MEESKKIYSEVLGVLLALGNKYVKKLPATIMPYLMKNCNFDSIPVIDKNKRIEEQNISEEARMLLTMIKLKYWCDYEEEKSEIIKILNENEKQYKEELIKKYNPDNLFKSKKNSSERIQDNAVTETAIVNYKEKNLIRKLFNKIKHLFKKTDNL